jgi:DNA-binding NarL/FixJ family response regulator
MPARILIADDHPVMLAGLADLLSREADLELCGEANSATGVFEAIDRLNPDLLILDLYMGAEDDLELVSRIHARWPALRILVLSMQDESLLAERIIAMGARGYVMKKEASRSVLSALRKILAGGYYLSPELNNRILSRSSGSSYAPNTARGLTDREREVLADMAAGKTTQEIAAHLGINIKTVDSHRRVMREKLGLNSASELVRYAIQWSQTDDGSPPG